MAFSSISFIIFFLPVFFLFYYVFRGKKRVYFLLFASFVFYSWGEIRYLPLMVGTICLNYFSAVLMTKHPKRKRLLMALAVGLDLLSLFFFKYFTPMMTGLFRTPQMSFFPSALPLGISFFTFQAISYVVDVYRGDTAAQRDPFVFATYITMFPQLIAGPIVRYTDIENQIHGIVRGEQKANLDTLASGVRRFIIGLCKKVLLANALGEAWSYLSVRPSENGVLGCWFGVICYCLQIYYDFSGYSDMAIGLGRMMGFSFPVNFDHPYTASSVAEFWSRWHITLSRFFRDYVYIPLGGNRKGVLRTILNMLIVWTLTGLWHGASLNFVLWGLYYWVFLVIERFLFRGMVNRVPKAVRQAGVFLLVTVSFVIFYFDATKAMGSYLLGMFSWSGQAISADAFSIVGSYGAWMLLGFVCAGFAPRKLYRSLARRFPRFTGVCQTAVLLLALLAAIAALAKQSYNPFIYFRF